MRARYINILLAIMTLALVACGSGAKQRTRHAIDHPAFSGDSAYSYVEKQLDFGPRVPGTEEHDSCVIWFVDKLRSFGGEVEVQEGVMVDYAGEKQRVRNIVARFDADSAKSRILLCAHYDSRPWCDEDTEDSWYQPVPAANDGASGVAVLMEVARQLQHKKANGERLRANVDIVLFDCEDMGTPRFLKDIDRQDTWCLGSQLWAKDTSLKGRYNWGILLDMVGAPGATFYREQYSEQMASAYVQKVWYAAADLGYDNFFRDQQAGAIVDDHYYIGKALSIPIIDIIHLDGTTGTFPFWWHTQQDDIQQIDRATLQAVGEVVMSQL
ncbi:MAG: M28 family peptidase [Paludibacteraceae bacterium]|nr:M28 family peptidase [Paludibacteraceae bacterium]